MPWTNVRARLWGAMWRVLVLGRSCSEALKAPSLTSWPAPAAAWASLRIPGSGWLGEPVSCSSLVRRAPEIRPDAQNHGALGEAHVTKEEAEDLSRPSQASWPFWLASAREGATFLGYPTGGDRGALSASPWLLPGFESYSPMSEFHLAGFAWALLCHPLTWH